MKAGEPDAVATPLTDNIYTASKTGFFIRMAENAAWTLTAEDKKDPPIVSHNYQESCENTKEQALPFTLAEEKLEPAIMARGPGAVAEPVCVVSKPSNIIENHGVTYSTTTGSFMHSSREIVGTISARDYKSPPVVNDVPSYGFYPQMKAESMCLTEDQSGCIVNGTNPGYQNGVVDTEYIVRRLTPVECARLQGFPDWWCSGLETQNPSDEEIAKWKEIFEIHKKALGKTTKPKTDNQIRKYLKNPHSDSAEYKMWGNGIALPNAVFVMSGIKWSYDKEHKK